MKKKLNHCLNLISHGGVDLNGDFSMLKLNTIIKVMKQLKVFFLIIFSISLLSMPSLEEIMGEGFESNDITEEEVLHIILLRCSAASYFLIGGNQQKETDLGDYFKDVAFGMGVVVSGQKGTLDKTAGEIEKENQELIDEYFEYYQLEGFNWYQEQGSPSDPKMTDIYSDFFNKDMVYCVEIYEKYGPKDDNREKK